MTRLSSALGEGVRRAKVPAIVTVSGVGLTGRYVTERVLDHPATKALVYSDIGDDEILAHGRPSLWTRLIAE